ncbi:gliding motility-associated C-terminal domain-containing protein [Penaeicola halotolerans]|uniref:T9SS type B sorting domain-containing protein n=1 Tax=Penaeicola halotolerans TaxID=2793196 RepID=UPI001CF873EC|nr:gliding motility-associated C-terminal domain-containing protein [Penaeicola halotolerans]
MALWKTIGDNAIYQGVATCDLSFTLLIYNRWGELIFSGESIGWDGRINGAEAEEGSYSYKMEYVYEQDGQLIKKALQGTFTLLR